MTLPKNVIYVIVASTMREEADRTLEVMRRAVVEHGIETESPGDPDYPVSGTGYEVLISEHMLKTVFDLNPFEPDNSGPPKTVICPRITTQATRPIGINVSVIGNINSGKSTFQQLFQKALLKANADYPTRARGDVKIRSIESIDQHDPELIFCDHRIKTQLEQIKSRYDTLVRFTTLQLTGSQRVEQFFEPLQ